ncbi:triose-phosphate transporter family-domain-containing protein [Phakopsora pachyrhizi]|uniref:Triose-phosphate transporter family-domain-containing protein n=1 Tax=Phakopsora pachyrhizi TaxID=170000 RepID=A0AAV0BTL6_PHAPC|nr:triose-phosphate transporter family-domain-containing protein [Phakopsora pachyrhizi]
MINSSSSSSLASSSTSTSSSSSSSSSSSPSTPSSPLSSLLPPNQQHHQSIKVSSSSSSSSPFSFRFSLYPTLSSNSRPLKPKSHTILQNYRNHHLSVRPRSNLSVQLDSSVAWLIYYFAFNLGLTIYNKTVLISFPFPWTLTAIHTLAGTIGTQLALRLGYFQPARLNRRHSVILISFSILYTVNIAISNLSLHLVTVPFHQVVRATTPLFTILISVICFRNSYPLSTYLSLLIVVSGVGLSTYGDYGWTTTGLMLTLLGTILASVKTIVTNVIQVGRLRLNPLDLLMRMSPLAFVQCVMYSYSSGEMARVREFGATRMDRTKVLALVFNGLIAFGLNVVSFTANKKTGALTMTVAANVKQVLTIVLAIFVFDLVITPTNLIGITFTLVGGAYYAKIELDKKQRNGLNSNQGILGANSCDGLDIEKIRLRREQALVVNGDVDVNDEDEDGHRITIGKAGESYRDDERWKREAAASFEIKSSTTQDPLVDQTVDNHKESIVRIIGPCDA